MLWDLRSEDAVPEDEYSMAHVRDLLDIRGENHDRGAVVRRLAYQLEQLLFGPGIHALRGFMKQQDLRPRLQPSRQDDLLLIAAAELGHLLRGEHRAHAETPHLTTRKPCLGATAQAS